MTDDMSAAAFVADGWLGLRWSAWMPLMAAHPLALAQLPSEPGLYRIRQSQSPRRPLWIGWEPRGVREVVERLSRQVHMPVEPYDDPRSPAGMLWSLRRRNGAAFEVSGAALSEADMRQVEYREAVRSAACLTLSTE